MDKVHESGIYDVVDKRLLFYPGDLLYVVSPSLTADGPVS